MESLNIGLVDFGYRSPHLNSLIKLEDVINYAIAGEEMGFDKFWIGEHHMPRTTLPWNCPTNLIPILAAHTHRIHIGTAGVLICIHTPYHIASAYKFYNSIFSGRIELGFANGMPYQGVAKHSTGKENSEVIQEFEQKMRQTISLLRDEEELYRKDGIILPPYKGALPDLWTLGGSEKSIRRALELGTNLCIWTSGEFQSAEKDKLTSFKERFFERFGRYPKVRAVVMGICHSSERKAQAIAREQNEEPTIFCGDATKLCDTLLKYSDFYAIQDFMFFNLTLDPKERLQGVEKLSYHLGLQPLPGKSRHRSKAASSLKCAPVN